MARGLKLFSVTLFVDSSKHISLQPVSEFKRWLKQNGCQFKAGANHEKVIRGAFKSVIPRHGSKQIALGTMHAIKKQLGL